MDQDGVAGLHAIGAPQQVLRGEPLQHHRRTLLEADRVRQFHQALGRHVAHFGVGAERAAGIGDAVAHRDIGHALADRLHHARALQADTRRQADRIQAGPVVGIDVVETDRVVAHARLARSRSGQIHRLPLQDFGTAGLMEADGVAHAGLLARAALI